MEEILHDRYGNDDFYFIFLIQMSHKGQYNTTIINEKGNVNMRFNVCTHDLNLLGRFLVGKCDF